MFFSTSIVLLSATISAFPAVIPRDQPPAGWWTDGLEDYNAFHTRYIALSCFSQHNTTFFDSCCHPLLKTETLADNRAPECDPANIAECDDGSDTKSSCDPTPAPAPASSAPDAPAPPAAPVNVAPDPPADSSPAPPPADTPKPSPKSAPKPKPAPAPAPAPAPPSSNVLKSSGNGGMGTFFYQNNNPGSCGNKHSDNESVVALDFRTYSASGDCGSSSLCGKSIKITNLQNNKTVTAIVADCCPTCTNSNSVDLSVGAFNQIATQDQGEVPISWQIFNN